MIDSASQPASTGSETSQDELYRALNDFVVNCPELRELEQHLGRFNLFRVLRFEDGEIRHSNVLAWLFTPEESHGLRDLFLRRFLMRVFNDAENGAPVLDPVTIDFARFDRVEVRREWQNIDLYIRIETDAGEWVVAIENKVNSRQHSDQLKRYRSIVEGVTAPGTKRIYIFLTKHAEEPDDDAYISATYEQVHAVLKSCVKEQEGTIGSEPGSLIRNYLNLLEERFMDTSVIAELARKIYASHRVALDAIYDNLPNPQQDLANRFAAKVGAEAASHGLVPMPADNHHVRFIPKAWNTAKNRAGTAWGSNGVYILCECPLYNKRLSLKVVIGGAPSDWAQKAWDRSQSAPFKRYQKAAKRPNDCLLVYGVRSDIWLDGLEYEDVENVVEEAWKWLVKRLNDKSFKETAAVVAELIEDLPEPTE